MATHIKIISQKDIQLFDLPPSFTGEERKKYLSIPVWAKPVLETFRAPPNQVGFILQLGYFKAVQKFFVSSKFHPRDIEFVVRRMELFPEEIDLSNYKDRTFERHQEIILQHLGCQKFDKQAKSLLMQESLFLCSKQTKPRLMFLSLVDFLRRKKIEVPNYYAISEVITQTLRDFERSLVESLHHNVFD